MIINRMRAENVLKYAQEAYEWRTLAKANGITIEYVTESVCKELDIQPVLIHSKSRKRNLSRARSIISWICVNKLEESSRMVARTLGMSPSAVSKAIPRGSRDKRSESIWMNIIKDRQLFR